MRILVIFSAVVCVLIIGSVSWTGTAASDAQQRRAVAEFTKPITVHGVVLKGKYLFVHDDVAMNRGDACTYIYEGEVPVRDKLVTSFHCIHIERPKAKNFVWRAR